MCYHMISLSPAEAAVRQTDIWLIAIVKQNFSCLFNFFVFFCICRVRRITMAIWQLNELAGTWLLLWVEWVHGLNRYTTCTIIIQRHRRESERETVQMYCHIFCYGKPVYTVLYGTHTEYVNTVLIQMSIKFDQHTHIQTQMPDKASERERYFVCICATRSTEYTTWWCIVDAAHIYTHRWESVYYALYRA